jgi:endonuclease YncB( thermonuclease family)
MLRALVLSAFIAAIPMPAPAGAVGRDDSGRVAWVTDGDTFRLESGERIRIAGIDAPETQRDQAKCAGETLLGLRAKDAPQRCSRDAR